MKIGIPKALLYYRYGCLWETFFRELGSEIISSGDSNQAILSSGVKNAVDENCLPLKVFLGHVQALIGKCDYILVPRFAREGRNEEYCVRFWGLPDLVRNTFGDASIISYNLDAAWRGSEPLAFMRMGKTLCKSPARALAAYREGVQAQQRQDECFEKFQREILASKGLKILIAAQPYLVYDRYIGGVIQKLIDREGAIALFSDRCDRQKCLDLSRELSQSLYWTMNKEAIGAIVLNKAHVDGVILLTAFPCGTDSLVNELVLRKTKDVPVIQILLDEHQAQAGLETRIESFLDILKRRKQDAEQAYHQLSPHGGLSHTD